MVKHARDQYAFAEAAFKNAEDKAGAILSYLGGGASLLALGSIAGLAVNQLSPWVILAGAVSFVYALRALVYAARARHPIETGRPPDAMVAARRAEWFELSPTQAEASLIGTWHLATVLLLDAAEQKLKLVERANWMLIRGIGWLALPLIVSLALKVLS